MTPTRTTSAPTAQSFCESLPWAIDLLWQGDSGTHRLDDERRAVLTLTTYGQDGPYATVGQYLGFEVTIVSKRAGTITSKVFRFDHYLADRADARDDYPHGGEACFKVVAHCGWRWYIAVPSRPEQFTEAVEAWIGEWR